MVNLLGLWLFIWLIMVSRLHLAGPVLLLARALTNIVNGEADAAPLGQVAALGLANLPVLLELRHLKGPTL
ncbi:hypothetical protein CRG98_049549, partial [Punica granatum]